MTPENLIKAARAIKRNCLEHERKRDGCVGCPFLGERKTADGKTSYTGCVLNDTFPGVWEIGEGG